MLATFVENEEAVSIKSKAASICDPGKSSPDFVFCNGATRFRYLDFKDLALPSFGELLKDIANVFKDRELYFVMTAPRGFFAGWVSGVFFLKEGWVGQDYIDAVTCQALSKYQTAPFHVAINGFIFGDSAQWAIYFDRDLALMIAALASNDTVQGRNWPTAENMWLSKQGARDLVLSYTSDESPYKETRDLFFHNYGLVDNST